MNRHRHFVWKQDDIYSISDQRSWLFATVFLAESNLATLPLTCSYQKTSYLASLTTSPSSPQALLINASSSTAVSGITHSQRARSYAKPGQAPRVDRCIAISLSEFWFSHVLLCRDWLCPTHLESRHPWSLRVQCCSEPWYRCYCKEKVELRLSNSSELFSLGFQLEQGYHYVGFTRPSLLRLITTLQSFRARGNSLPAQVRAVHLSLGSQTPSERENVAFESHGTLGEASRLLALCPRLAHLSITSGDPHRQQRIQHTHLRALSFEVGDLELIAPLTPRTLVLNDRAACVRGSFTGPRCQGSVALQLLRLFAPSLRRLFCDASLQVTGADSLEEAPLLASLPLLEHATLTAEVAGQAYDLIKSAPQLLSLVLVQSHSFQFHEPLLAPRLRQLVIYQYKDEAIDLSQLQKLQSLRVINTELTRSVLSTVLSTHSSVSELWFDLATMIHEPWYLGYETFPEGQIATPRQLNDLLVQRTNVQRVVFSLWPQHTARPTSQTITRPPFLRDMTLPYWLNLQV